MIRFGSERMIGKNYKPAEVRPKANKRGNKPSLYIQLDYIHPETGEWVRRRFTNGLNRIRSYRKREIEASKLADYYNQLLDDGWLPELTEAYERGKMEKVKPDYLFPKLDEIVAYKLATYKNQSSARNVKSFVKRFKDYLESLGRDDWDLKEISPSLVSNYLDKHLVLTLSNTSRNNHHRQLRSIFEQFKLEELIEKNPFDHVKKLPESTSRHRVYKKEQIQKIGALAHEMNPGLKVFMQMIAYTFLRPVEIIRLTVGQIDSEANLIHVDASGTKTSSRQPVPLVAAIRDAIVEHCQGFPDHYALFGSNLEPAEKPCNQGLPSKKFKTIREELGLEKEYTLYGIRHTFISDLYHSFFEETQDHMEAKNRLRMITRHASVQALDKYLKEIGADQVIDYSERFTTKF